MRQKNQYIAIVILSIFMMISVNCQKENPIYTFKGTLYEDCNMTPMAHTALVLDISKRRNPSEVVTTTDAKGHFEFKYQEITGTGTELILSLREGSVLLERLPVNKDLNLEVIKNEVGTLKVTLASTEGYNNEDTLYYDIYGVGEVEGFLPAPFKNTAIDTITLKVLPPPFNGIFYNPRYNGDMTGTLYWGIGYEDFKKAQNSFFSGATPYHQVEFTLTGCNKIDEVIIDPDGGGEKGE